MIVTKETFGYYTKETVNHYIESLDKDNISVLLGITPHKVLSLGNMVTFLSAIQTLSKVEEDLGVKVDYLMAFDDLEDMSRDKKPLMVPKYKSYITPENEEISESEKVSDELNVFRDKVNLQFGTIIPVRSFSEIQSLPEFRKTVKKLANPNTSVYYICPECNTMNETQYKNTEKPNYELLTCINSMCSNYSLSDAVFDIENTNLEISFISPDEFIIMRDNFVIENSGVPDMHVLGSDYSINDLHYISQKSVMMGGEGLPFFRTNLKVYGKDDEEMHKSKNNFIGLRDLEKNPFWFEQLISLVDGKDWELRFNDYKHILPKFYQKFINILFQRI